MSVGLDENMVESSCLKERISNNTPLTASLAEVDSKLQGLKEGLAQPHLSVTWAGAVISNDRMYTIVNLKRLPAKWTLP